MINTVKSNGYRTHFNIEKVVRERYAKGAQRKEETLCCPVSYDAKFLEVIPQEILEKDYGCGDPSAYLKEGETVLDLGSGGGKICFIASQVVGPKGRVIGVDFNPAMLSLANQYKDEVAKKIGWKNIEFRRGKIQDLKTDLDALQGYLSRNPVKTLDDFVEMENAIRSVQKEHPLIADESVDVVVSNCVLNLVQSEDKTALFKEMHRVLKKGGRVAVSDIVSDEPVPQDMQNNPKLWSGCISGAFEEKMLLKAFEDAGFYGIKIEKRDEKPWRVVRGIEFRSITVTANKGKEGVCWEKNQAVIYKGPWKEVQDDDHHVLKRGVRTAVCDKTFQIFSKAPYKDEIILVSPRKEIPISKVKPFSATKPADPSSGGDCSRDSERDPRETKGLNYKANKTAKSSCLDGGCC